MKHIIRVYGRGVWVMDLKMIGSQQSLYYTAFKSSAKTFKESEARVIIGNLNKDLKPLIFEIDTME